MVSRTTIISHSPHQTASLAGRIARVLQPGAVLGLRGGLGSGKSTFVRGFLRALGVRRVISPTFVLAKSIRVRRGALRRVLHVDLYRLPVGSDPSVLGLQEYFGRSDTITLIEWCDRLVGRGRKMRCGQRLSFAIVGPNRRSIRLPASLAWLGRQWRVRLRR